MRWVQATAVVIASVTTLCHVLAAPSFAQGDGFTCPKAGITVKFRTASGVEWTTIYHGADPKDPVICLSTSSTETNSDSGERHRLYAWLPIGRLGVVDTPELRAALQSFFSGGKGSVTFRYAAYPSGIGPRELEDTLTRTGRDSITIGGQDIETTVVEWTDKHLLAQRSGTQRLWLDPKTGIFLKGEALTGGQHFSNTDTYQAISIALPN